MKIVQINTFSNGSTGNIMMNIHKELLKKGVDSYVVWGRGRKTQNQNEIYMNDKLGVYFHALYARLTGKVGFASKSATKKLIKKLDEIKPDIIHLHNLHGYYINIEILFNYIKENNVKVIWTLHDCWAFTGQCPHFTIRNCNKWKSQCYNCPMIHEYPKTIKDNSYWNYNKKKELFSNLNLTIVTPSEWLSKLVKESFLKKYEVKVINNGIDLNIFKKLDKKDLKFRKKYKLKDKKIILGVASPFTYKKGFYDFIKLSKVLNDNYRIVLVGLNKKQIRELPRNIIGIEKLNDYLQLVDIYNSADIFLNLTYEDNYPTVNLEAIACGIPVITYDTGGSTEFINYLNSTSLYYVIKKNNKSNDIVKEIKKSVELLLLNNDEFFIKDINSLDIKTKIKEYINLYQSR